MAELGSASCPLVIQWNLAHQIKFIIEFDKGIVFGDEYKVLLGWTPTGTGYPILILYHSLASLRLTHLPDRPLAGRNAQPALIHQVGDVDNLQSL